MKQKKTLKKENTQNSIRIFIQRVWVHTSLKFIEHQNEENKNLMFLISKVLIGPRIILLKSYVSMKTSFNNSYQLYM